MSVTPFATHTRWPNYGMVYWSCELEIVPYILWDDLRLLTRKHEPVKYPREMLYAVLYIRISNVSNVLFV